MQFCSGLILGGYGTMGEWMTLDPDNEHAHHLLHFFTDVCKVSLNWCCFCFFLIISNIV